MTSFIKTDLNFAWNDLDGNQQIRALGSKSKRLNNDIKFSKNLVLILTWPWWSYHFDFWLYPLFFRTSFDKFCYRNTWKQLATTIHFNTQLEQSCHLHRWHFQLFRSFTLFLVISANILTLRRRKWKRRTKTCSSNNRVRNYVWPEG